MKSTNCIRGRVFAADRSGNLLRVVRRLQVEAARTAARPQVVISGAVGPNAARVNGRFEQVEREVYRKVGEPGRWLFVAKDGTWWVSTTAKKDDRKTESGGWAHSVASASGMPPLAGEGRWKVFFGGGKWDEQTVEVEVLDAAFQSSSSTAPVPAPKKVIQYYRGGLQTSSTFTVGVPVQLKKSMAAMAAAEAVATQRCAIEPGGAVADAKSNRTIAGGCCSEVSQARKAGLLQNAAANIKKGEATIALEACHHSSCSCAGALKSRRALAERRSVVC